MVEFITPIEMHSFRVESDYYGNLRLRVTDCASYSTWGGKQLCFGLKNAPSQGYAYPVHLAYDLNCSTYPFLYVSPECSISRDTLRNSGFKIVRNKEKASCVLLPPYGESASFTYNVCVIIDGKNVNLFNIEKKSNLTEERCDKILELIKGKYSSLDQSKIRYIFNPLLESANIYVVPKCENYIDLYTGSADGPFYGFEDCIELIPSIEVTPELFTIWDKCNELDVIACALANCDWQKYPVTLAMYLYENKQGIRHHANSSQSFILKCIGFYDLWRNGTMDRVVEPEDWNMLQKCMLYSLGLPETGGLLKASCDSVSKGLPCRIQVKPMYIKEPALFKDLMTAMKNM